MKKCEALIFDMDGTLYTFDNRSESHFTSSRFGQTIFANCVRFFEKRFELSTIEAMLLYEELNTQFNGEVSLAVEQKFGITRQEYFASTWDLPVESFVTPDIELGKMLTSLAIKSGVLTAAPSVWAEKVLQFLGVRQVFGDDVFTGDPDIRKPNPRAFSIIAEKWNLPPEQIISIGDQELTDILPAKSIGMKTVRIANQAESEADFVAPNVVAALKILEQKGFI